MTSKKNNSKRSFDRISWRRPRVANEFDKTFAGIALKNGFDPQRHPLFTQGHVVITSNCLGNVKGFTDAQKEAVARLTENLGRKKYLQITVSLKHK